MALEEYDRSSVSYSLLSYASISVICAFSILRSAFARRPLSPGSLLALVAIEAIESRSIRERADFRDMAEMLLSLDITDWVSSLNRARALGSPPLAFFPEEMTEASRSKRSFAISYEPTRAGLNFCNLSLICCMRPWSPCEYR